jgi:ABC-type dipeptide/oligopeptide/nickel transport system ATPase component
MNMNYKPNPEYLVEVNDLKMYFPVKTGFFGTTPLKAADGVSFAIRPGETLGLVGESGCGKTTVGRALIRLYKPTDGDIFFEGKNIPDLSEKELRTIRGAKIGMIFQDAGASLCPIRTIGEQIYESMSAHGQISKAEAKEKALDLFDKLHFKNPARIWDSYPFEMSGGMNQRAGIAIAMLMNPSILLADEPTSALDVSVQKQVVMEMLQLREMFGMAIILVTHDIGVVSAMADRILVLKDGNTMEYGNAADILNHPQNDYTKKLLSAVPRLRRC